MPWCREHFSKEISRIICRLHIVILHRAICLFVPHMVVFDIDMLRFLLADTGFDKLQGSLIVAPDLHSRRLDYPGRPGGNSCPYVL